MQMWLLQMCGCGHFPGGPGFKTASSARGAGSILSRETNKIPHAIQSGQKKEASVAVKGAGREWSGEQDRASEEGFFFSFWPHCTAGVWDLSSLARD